MASQNNIYIYLYKYCIFAYELYISHAMMLHVCEKSLLQLSDSTTSIMVFSKANITFPFLRVLEGKERKRRARHLSFDLCIWTVGRGFFDRRRFVHLAVGPVVFSFWKLRWFRFGRLAHTSGYNPALGQSLRQADWEPPSWGRHDCSLHRALR